ncbi:MAG: AAA family ATPase [Myxococcota bacterium]
MTATASRSFPERFTWKEALGSGQLGEVDLVHDHDLEIDVALKNLPTPDPGLITSLKHEFRLASSLEHRNLVRLYELLIDDHHCAFTMEPIHGDLFTIVLSQALEDGDDERVRSLVSQLVAGVAQLHDAHIIHRDVKPTNVLVEHQSDRVVVLDLDLAWSTRLGMPRSASGTPQYMAPEALWGRANYESDWYGVGATLCEAVWGAPPSQVVRHSDGVPSWLVSVIDELLSEKPEDRPNRFELRQKLGLDAPSAPPYVPLLGRKAELARFDQALENLRRGLPDALLVTGPSGMGKSRLLEEFLLRARPESDVLILTGNCRNAETLPFKAIDPLVASLTDHIDRRRREDAAWWDPPEEWWPATYLFPELVQVLSPPPPSGVVHLPEARRRLAIVALRGLLGWLAQQSRLVWMLDDAQWGDEASAGLLRQLVTEPTPLPVLMVVAARTEPSLGPFVEAWRLSTQPDVVQMQRLLTADIEELLGETIDPSMVKQVAEQCDGNPFLLQEAVRNATLGRTLNIHDVEGERLRGLSPIERDLATLLALAKGPVPRAAVLQAIGASADAFSAILSLERLGLLHVVAGDRTLATGHARYRERLLSEVDDRTRRSGHGRLADALARFRGLLGPARLLPHLIGAERFGEVCQVALEAAATAQGTSRFEEEAAYLEMAIEYGPVSDRWSLMERQGDAWRAAGLGPKASQAYLEALAASDQRGSLAQRRRLLVKAGQELIRHGEQARGTELLRTALRELGVRAPRTANAALMMGVFTRLPVYLWGLIRAPHREDKQLPARVEERLNALWMATNALSQADVTLSFALSGRYLAEAVRCRAPKHMHAALGTEAAIHASIGNAASTQRVDELLTHITSLADATDEEWRIGTPAFIGVAAWHLGRWAEAEAASIQATNAFRRSPIGHAWELATMQHYAFSARFFRGDIEGLQDAVDEAREAAIDRGDRHAASALALGEPGLVRLLEGRPEEAHRALKEADQAGFVAGPDLTTYYYTVLEGHLALFEGRFHDARRVLEERWPLFRQGRVLDVQNARAWLTYLKGIAIARTSERQQGASRLRACVRTLKACTTRPAAGMASALEARRAKLLGRPTEAAEAQARADEQLAKADTWILRSTSEGASWLRL